MGEFAISSTAAEFCVAGRTKGGSKGACSMREEAPDGSTLRMSDIASVCRMPEIV